MNASFCPASKTVTQSGTLFRITSRFDARNSNRHRKMREVRLELETHSASFAVVWEPPFCVA